MQDRLHAVVLNLAVLEALKDYDKLRILSNDLNDTATTPLVSVEHSHLAIDERVFLQGGRRAMSGDGHATTITFFRKLIDEVRQIANEAFSRMKGASAVDSGPHSDLFDVSPRQILHTLSCACASSKKGIDRLRQTSYADSQQIGVELSDINRDFDSIIANIGNVLTAS